MRERLAGRHSPGFLASVRSEAEAVIALANGAEIIDIKEPATGALGAADDATVRAIVTRVRRIESDVTISATVGDLPVSAPLLIEAVRSQAATGVDIVKIGLLPDAARPDCVAALRVVARDHPVIVVLAADRESPVPGALDALLSALAGNGFLGVMFDTFDKRCGSLADVWPAAALQRFVDAARSHRLVCGLAGSLRLADVVTMAALAPDVLGFRGALCESDRIGTLEGPRVRAVADALVASRRVGAR